MDVNKVNEVLEETFQMALDMVAEKGKTYHHEEDRLAHLKQTAVATGLTPLRSVHALVSKHFTALPAMLDKQDKYSMEKFDEYIVDILVYTGYIRCLLLEAKQNKKIRK